MHIWTWHQNEQRESFELFVKLALMDKQNGNTFYHVLGRGGKLPYWWWCEVFTDNEGWKLSLCKLDLWESSDVMAVVKVASLSKCSKGNWTHPLLISGLKSIRWKQTCILGCGLLCLRFILSLFLSNILPM